VFLRASESTETDHVLWLVYIAIRHDPTRPDMTRPNTTRPDVTQLNRAQFEHHVIDLLVYNDPIDIRAASRRVAHKLAFSLLEVEIILARTLDFFTRPSTSSCFNLQNC
jgi:hypothetical protein